MGKDTTNMKDNIALLAKVFDFLSRLDEEQISGLRENKVKLTLDVQVNGQLDALITEKLNEKLSTLIDEKLGVINTENAAVSAKGPRKGKNKKEVSTGGAKPKGKQAKDKSGGKADRLAVIASELRALSSVDSITDYFEKNPLKIGSMKSLANKHFGVAGTVRMNTNDLIKAIIEVIMKPQPGEAAE